MVNYSVDTYRSLPLGAYSLNLAANAYRRFVSPFITHPYAQNNIAPYVSPYYHKVDHMGDNTLKTIDAHFPIVNSKPEELQNLVLTTLRKPLEFADEGKKYVTDVWGNEYKKCGGDGYVAAGKAIVTTSLVVGSEALGNVAAWLQQKETAAKAKVNERMQESKK